MNINSERVQALAEEKLATMLAMQQAAAMLSPMQPTSPPTTDHWPADPINVPISKPLLSSPPVADSPALVSPEPMNEPRTLNAAFDLLSAQESWQERTQGEYQTMLNRWRDFHDGAGPDVAQISEEMLLEFIGSVESWRSYRTRDKQLCYITKILKAVAPKNGRAKYGMRQSKAWISEVPFVRLPKPPRATTAQAWRETTVTADDIGRMYEAAGSLDNPVRWQTLILIVWLFGPRRNDLLLMPWDAIDNEKQTLAYIETKRGNPVGPLPIPDYLSRHLDACKSHGWGDSILGFTKKQIRNNSGKIYSRIYSLYNAAGVAVPVNSGGKLSPLHGLRSACITNWKAHAEGLQRFVVGHQFGSDTSDRHYARVGDMLRDKIQTLPVPEVFKSGPNA